MLENLVKLRNDLDKAYKSQRPNRIAIAEALKDADRLQMADLIIAILEDSDKREASYAQMVRDGSAY